MAKVIRNKGFSAKRKIDKNKSIIRVFSLMTSHPQGQGFCGNSTTAELLKMLTMLDRVSKIDEHPLWTIPLWHL